MNYFLGADVGATKTHILIADETGQAVSWGQSGPGNHETVGYDGLSRALGQATEQALAMGGINAENISGAGYGVAGYDWPVEREPTLKAIATLGLSVPTEAVNDALIGLLAGSEAGWGIAVVSGTGCNCQGWDRERRIGQVTGASLFMGEAGGASELVARAIQMVAHSWTKRGPETRLAETFLKYTKARDLPDLLHNLAEGEMHLPAKVAPLIFEAAAAGDAVARDVIRWTGRELGEMAKAVIRQLDFAGEAFDVVMVGSLFNGGPMLIEPMQESIYALAPKARFVRLQAPPVVGAVLLGLEQVGLAPDPVIREKLIQTAQTLMS